MKKITALSLILILFSVAASAQRGAGNRLVKHRTVQGFNHGQITRVEKFQLKKEVVQLNMLQQRVQRDGIVTPLERIRVQKAKCNIRRDAFHFKHNGRNRMI